VGADRGRSEVYAAELAAYDGTDLEDPEPFPAIEALVASVLATPWWAGGPVRLQPARRDARSSSTRVGGPDGVARIRLARPQWTRATAVHELAHALVGLGAGHGSLFRRAHVDVATVAFGAERGTWLRDAYAAAGLALAERWWAPPPSTSAPVWEMPRRGGSGGGGVSGYARR